MVIHCSYKKLVRACDLKPHPLNPNKHSDAQIERLAKILKYQGWRYPIKVSTKSGYITSGHGRLMAALLNKWEEVPVDHQDYEDDAQEYADLVADNSIADWAELDLKAINADITVLGPDFDIDLLGIDGFTIDVSERGIPGEDEAGAGSSGVDPAAHLKLADRFLIPPFSVLNAREGWWQDRKRSWIALGIKSELGRGGGLLMSSPQVTTENLNYYRNRSVQ